MTRRYLIGRLALIIVVLWAASVIVFIAFYAITDPVTMVVPIGTSQATINEYRHTLGLDQPLVVQYWRFLSGILHGDFGQSLWLGGSALQQVLIRIPVTVALVAPSVVLGALLGAGLGTAAAVKPGSWLDNLITTGSYLGISMPPFWVGLMLLLLVAGRVDWVATYGFQLDAAHLILPVATLMLLPAGHVAQVTRSLIISESHQQYVTTARAKGLSELQVAIKHKLRNAAPAVVTLIFYDFARMFVGDALIVEVVFGWQGVGGLSAQALERGDIYLGQAAVMLACIVVACSNLVADLLHERLDPRARDTQAIDLRR
jgi:peptide/nickel transport system permease protein